MSTVLGFIVTLLAGTTVFLYKEALIQILGNGVGALATLDGEIHTDTHRYTQIHSVSGPVLDTHQIHTWIHTRYTHKAGRLRLVGTYLV